MIYGDGQTQENLYDAEGLRYRVKENGRLSGFVYHRGELLQEEREGGEISYHLGSGIEAAQVGEETYYYHQDEQLSTALLSDHVGKVRDHYRYSAFGEMLEGEESVGNRIRYTGQCYDKIGGQYYLRARYYNPAVGRFLQEDVYQGDGLNLYAYCGNNPVMYYDSSGYISTGNGGYDNSLIDGDGGEEGSKRNYKVSDSRREHILEGDPPGTGHGPNRGNTRGAFPDTWNDDQTIAAIEQVANSPNSTWKQATGPGYRTAPISQGGPDSSAPLVNKNGSLVRFKVYGQNHGLDIVVIIEPSGEGIITGYVKR